MAEPLDPRLEASLRGALHHNADALPFTLTVDDVLASRRRRRAARRVGVPVSILAAAAVVVVLVVAASALWTTPRAGTESASPNLRAAELASYDSLAGGVTIVKARILARGEELVGAPVAGDVVVGAIPASDYVDVVIDCRGGDIRVGLRLGNTPGGSMGSHCDQIGPQTTFTIPGFAQDGAEVYVHADPGTVWRLVVGGSGEKATSLPSFEDLAAVATSTHEVAREEQPVLDASEGLSAYHFLKLGDLWNLEIAAGCSGPGDIVVTTSGAGDPGNKAAFTCDGTANVVLLALLDDVTSRAAGADLVLEYPAGVSWRLIVYDRSAGPTKAVTVPEAAFPSTVVASYGAAPLLPGGVTIKAEPVPDGATLEVAFGCVGDPSAIIRVAVDGVGTDMGCFETNIRQFVPDGSGASTVTLDPDRAVRIALEVRAFTRDQVGGKVVPPGATMSASVGKSSASGFATCLKAFASSGGETADEGCGPGWYQIPEARAVRTIAEDTPELTAGNGSMVSEIGPMTYVPTSSITSGQTSATPVSLPAADGPGVEGGFTLPALPAGDWTLAIDVTGRLDNGTTFTETQLFRVILSPGS